MRLSDWPLVRPGALLFALALSACAGDIARPDIVQALPESQKANLQVSQVSAAAKPGVVMTQQDIDRITQRVKAELDVQRALGPAPAQPRNVAVKMVFTQYDEGNRFARFMLVGLGQIHIDADVSVLDAATGDNLGQYEVSKDFALGGIYGGATSIEDVEKGFARSVAEIFKQAQ